MEVKKREQIATVQTYHNFINSPPSPSGTYSKGPLQCKSAKCKSNPRRCVKTQCKDDSFCLRSSKENWDSRSESLSNKDEQSTYEQHYHHVRAPDSGTDSNSSVDRHERGRHPHEEHVLEILHVNHTFLEVLNYRTSPLADKLSWWAMQFSRSVAKWASRLHVPMKSKEISSFHSVSITSFLFVLKLTCDTNGLQQGAIFWVSGFILKRRPTAALNSLIAPWSELSKWGSEGTMTSSCKALIYVLETYPTDNEIAEIDSSITCFTSPKDSQHLFDTVRNRIGARRRAQLFKIWKVKRLCALNSNVSCIVQAVCKTTTKRKPRASPVHTKMAAEITWKQAGRCRGHCLSRQSLKHHPFLRPCQYGTCSLRIYCIPFHQYLVWQQWTMHIPFRYA